jgi:DNA-binding NarL/FixJ family response regulator
MEPDYSMESISVLIADDDPYIRQCIRRALEIDPVLQVKWEADNGLEAVVLTGKHHPDVVLLDAEMPRMDGFEAAQCIRQRQPDLCIVIMSIYEQARSRALESGAAAFIVKGSGCKVLRATVRDALRACSPCSGTGPGDGASGV